MSNKVKERSDSDSQVQEAQPQLKQPSLYQVVLLNDDYTPMDFVVEILEKFFYMSREQSTRVMMHVHTRGKGVCGIYAKDIAETRRAQIMAYAREKKHPLKAEVEKV